MRLERDLTFGVCSRLRRRECRNETTNMSNSSRSQLLNSFRKLYKGELPKQDGEKGQQSDYETTPTQNQL